jgi:hypothetical protein
LRLEQERVLRWNILIDFFLLPFVAYFIFIKLVLSNHLSYMIIFQCSLGKSHKASLTVILKANGCYFFTEFGYHLRFQIVVFHLFIKDWMLVGALGSTPQFSRLYIKDVHFIFKILYY